MPKIPWRTVGAPAESQDVNGFEMSPLPTGEMGVRSRNKMTEPWYDEYGQEVRLADLGLGTVALNQDADGYSWIMGKRGDKYTTRPFAGRSPDQTGLRSAKQSVR